MNSNLAHNLLNVLILIVSAMAMMDWTAFFEPGTAAAIVAGMTALKLVMNMIRDGVTGMVKEQPPVVQEPAEIDYSGER